MFLKKKYFIFLTLIISINLFSEEIDLAKFYIKKASHFYQNGKHDLSQEYIIKSREYSERFPELYYISNLLLPDNKTTLSQKRKNAENIVKNLRNGFLIDNYELLKQAAKVFEKVRDFNKSSELYDRYISDRNKNKLSDYIEYVKMLFNSDLNNKYKKIPAIINKANQIYDSLHLNYFMLLFEILYKNIDNTIFEKKLGVLISHNYSSTRILYLRSIQYDDMKNLKGVLTEYNNLLDKGNIEAGFNKRITYNLLKRSGKFKEEDVVNLLAKWELLGNDDQKTIDILGNKNIRDIVNKNEDLKNTLINFTGVRRKDTDNDGNWEVFFEYKNGIVVNKIVDKDQDGIYETGQSYFDNGKIKNYLDYNMDNSNYNKYVFNERDSSLLKVEIIKGDKLFKQYTMVQSSIFPDINKLDQIKLANILEYVAYEESWKDGYNITNYFNEKKEYEYLDNNNNGIYEKKIFYDNGMIDEVLSDLNEDGNFEKHEIYKNSELKETMYKTIENLETYDYKEVYFKDKVDKYWDNNLDNIFEIYIEEFNNGMSNKRFDIDFDGDYEYLYQYKNNLQKGIYYIAGDKKVLLKEYKEPYKEKKKNWKIVTIQDLEKVIIPDNIILEEKKSLSGMFSYNGKKFYFKNGLVKNELFSYRLFLINNVIYLFEIY